TVIQQDIAWKDVNTNIARAEKLIRAAERSDIYLLPEMCSTGFCMQPQGVAEEVEGLTVQAMKRLAVEFDAAIAVPVMTHENGKYYNRMYFITPEGIVGQYDKRNLFEYSGEDKVFEPGEGKVVWLWRGIRIRPAICYDLRFPLFLYNKAEYDLLLIAANFPDSRLLAWDTLVRARAIENMCYVAASNRVGTDEYGTYKGHSVILNPYGMTLAKCRTRRQGSATAELDPEMIAKLRIMTQLNR
ncbi:MAG: nitrilase family protein, partial [Bacteroidaceae bacterium]|nr:nitrilase family protein [Bacteroidaceae bacterium]